jgi:alpha-D-ribose 1-methylphosphonate 5-triphosphate diphosphatase PhnM
VPHSILRYFTLLFKDAILQYDHIFHIHCEARDIQLGAVISSMESLLHIILVSLQKPKQNISGRIFLEDYKIFITLKMKLTHSLMLVLFLLS